MLGVKECVFMSTFYICWFLCLLLFYNVSSLLASKQTEVGSVTSEHISELIGCLRENIRSPDRRHLTNRLVKLRSTLLATAVPLKNLQAVLFSFQGAVGHWRSRLCSFGYATENIIKHLAKSYWSSPSLFFFIWYLMNITQELHRQSLRAVALPVSISPWHVKDCVLSLIGHIIPYFPYFPRRIR